MNVLLATLWVPSRLPDFNAILAACGSSWSVTSRSGERRFNSKYAQLKKKWGESIRVCARAQRMPPIGCGFFTYLAVEKKRNRDPSNIMAGAVKLIEDALQGADVIENDGWKQILGYAQYWDVGEPQGVWLAITSEAVLTRDEAISLSMARRDKLCRTTRNDTR